MTLHNPPQKWQWVRLGECLEKMTTAKLDKDTFSYIDIESINSKTQTITTPKTLLTSKAPSRAKREVKEGDTLFSMVRPYLKNIAFVDSEFSHCVASTGFYVCRPKPNILPKYLFFVMISPLVVIGLNRFMRGDNSPSIRSHDLEGFSIPLPPLEIQREIVEILESKLEKIKEAKALLETSLQECETYRLSLLESAFSGNLTPHSQNWQWVRLGEVCDTSSGGTPSRTQLSYWDGEIKWLKSGELNDGLIDNVGETITQEGLKHSSAKLLPKGTLLIAMYGATIGRLGILNVETSTNQAICAITPKEENTLDTKFLFYFLFASRPKMLQDSFGGAQKNISQAYLKQFSIPLPPLEIQREIVEILESKLEKIKEAKALLETSLQECETYRLSLLESAFAGELV